MHNLWANERNGRQRVQDFLAEIPLDRIWEIHVAGGLEFSGYWLDAHSGEIPKPVLELTEWIVPKLPNLSAIIFEILSPFILRFGLAQLEKLRELWNSRHKAVAAPTVFHLPPIEDVGYDLESISPTNWEDTLGALVIGRNCENDLWRELLNDPGTAIIRKLIWDFRAGIIVDTLKLSCRLIMLLRGEAFLRELLTDFFTLLPPGLFASLEAEAFVDYLDERHLAIPYLSEILAFEQATLEVLVNEEPRIVRFPCDPHHLLSAINQGYVPEQVIAGNYEVVVTPDEDEK